MPEEATATRKRAYDSPVRRRQVAETRERILAAASELVHGFPSWDWDELTFRAVAERAGVSERTVYRHFPSERELNDALLEHLADEAGVSYAGLDLDDIAPVAARMLASLSSFEVSALADRPPQFASVDRQRRDAVLEAVAAATNDWPEAERRKAAAVLDVLWGIPSFERIAVMWGLDADAAMDAITWAIGLVVEAVRAGNRPETAKRSYKRLR
jgi:AcrR family transcriptional regulator